MREGGSVEMERSMEFKEANFIFQKPYMRPHPHVLHCCMYAMQWSEGHQYFYICQDVRYILDS